MSTYGQTGGQQFVHPFGSAAAGEMMWGRDQGANQSVTSPPAMTGQQPFGQQAGQMGRKFGAHEILMVHEVLDGTINSINLCELYKPHVKDQQLMQIIDKQVGHMYSGYQGIVNYLHNQGGSQAVPYRAPKAPGIKYGLRQPSPMVPNANVNEMDDWDVASGLMECCKAKALKCTSAALECADPTLRQMMTDCAVSAINQAYELFCYMNQKGMYQVPTLADQTTQTMVNTYQIGAQPQL